MITSRSKNNNNPKCAIERMPTTSSVKTLKEFLHDDDYYLKSCSSSGFTTIPRRIGGSNPKPINPPATLPRSRSRSRAAAEAALSSFQNLLDLSKKLLTWSPSSKKLTNTKRRRFDSSSTTTEGKVKVKVKVKDILRWRSFRDVAEEKSQPLDSATTIITVPANSGSTTSSSTSKGSSSWADSEFSFTADELPCWWGNNNHQGKFLEVEGGKKCNNFNNHVDVDVGGGDHQVRKGTTTETTDSASLVSVTDPEHEENITSCEEDKEQHSPVSVLNSPFRDETSDEELVSSFDQSFDNIERTKQRLLQSIQWFESLAGVEDDQWSLEEEDQLNEQQQEQELAQTNENNNANDKAKNKVYLISGLGRFKRAGQGLKDKEVCIKDMEVQDQWSKFGEEKQEMGMEMQDFVLNDLIDDVLVDLFG